MYNAAATIAETLGSLQAQTRRDWEAIVVNDASDDASCRIVEAISARDERIRLIDSKAHGPGAARNTGIGEAAADWLVFLDADDWISPDYLAEMLDARHNDDSIDAVVCHWARVYPDGSQGRTERCLDVDAIFPISACACPFAIHACLIRKSLVIEAGGFDEHLRYGEDWHLWQKIARGGAEFVQVDRLLALYRIHKAPSAEGLLRSLDDAIRVIELGASKDPDVPRPAPQFAEGGDRRLVADAVWCQALYLAGCMLGRKSSPLPLLERAGSVYPLTAPPQDAATWILEGAGFSARFAPVQWPRRWAEFRDGLLALAEALQRYSKLPRLERQIRNACTSRIIDYGPKTEAYRIDDIRVAAIDVYADIGNAVTAGTTTGRIALNVNIGESHLGCIVLDTPGTSPQAAAVRAAIASRFQREIILDVARRQFGADAVDTRGKRQRTIDRLLDDLLAPAPAQDDAEAPRPRLMACEAIPGTSAAADGQGRDVLLRVGGELIGRYILDAEAADCPSALLSATRALAGGEVAQSVLRQAVIGRPRAGSDEIRQRLSAAAVAYVDRQQGPANDAGAGPSGFVPIAEHRILDSLVTKLDKLANAETGRNFFERLFAGGADPWDYTNPYETAKYEQTLSLIGDEPIASALEVACAEGHFTARLASRVGHLTATDFSAIALERAAQRCRGIDNVSFRELNLETDPLGSGFDLIVCSEVLYYLGDRDKLRRVADKLAEALAPGGRLVMAHAHLIVDEPEKPGFNWKHAYGARTISDVFSAHPDLTLLEEIVTPLYRAQSYGGVKNKAAGKPQVRRQVFDRQPAPPPPRAHGSVCWQGSAAIHVAQETNPAWVKSLPILVYHRVGPPSEDALAAYCVGPAAFARQMAFLKQAGYYTIGWETLLAHMAYDIPFPGLPFIITFDDGYEDLTEFAMPILEENGFTATVLLVSGAVGATNKWDSAYDRGLALLDWPEITAMRSKGITFASHSLSHPPLSALDAAEMATELSNSKRALEARLGKSVDVVAYPYGDHDDRVVAEARAAGYRVGLTTVARHCRLSDDPLRLPRLEIGADMAFDTFVTRISHSRFDTSTAPLAATCRFLTNLGHLDLAIDTARSWMALCPGHLGFALQCVGLLDAAGRDEEADALLQALATGDWPAPEQYIQLGDAFAARDQPEAALSTLAAGASRFAENGAISERMGRLHLQRGDLDAAAGALEAALAADPDSARLRGKLALVRERQGRLEEAVKLVAEAAASCPDDGDLHLRLASLLLRLERFEHAEAALRRALDLDAARPETFVKLSQALAGQERVGEAVDLLERGAQRFPGNAGILQRKGALLFQSRRFGEAAETLAAALSHEHGLPATHILLANALDELGETEAAAEAIVNAMRLYPDNASLPTRLAALHMAHGAFAEAEEMLRRAIGLNSQDPRLYVRLATACSRQGRQAEAADIIAGAASRFPGNAELRQRLEKIAP